MKLKMSLSGKEYKQNFLLNIFHSMTVN